MDCISVAQAENKCKAAPREHPNMSAKLWPAENTGPSAARTMPLVALQEQSRAKQRRQDRWCAGMLAERSHLLDASLKAEERASRTSSDRALRLEGLHRVITVNGPC
jgi:hypothetical protein